MSWGSSSLRPSSCATRERRSANSQEARSMMASARREVTISSSMASSETSEKLAMPVMAPPADVATPLLRAPGACSSPGRVLATPRVSTWRRPLTMPRCQACAPVIRLCTSSRRRCAVACSLGLSCRLRACSMAVCTTPTRPLTSSSVYKRRAWLAMASGAARSAMSAGLGCGRSGSVHSTPPLRRWGRWGRRPWPRP